MGATANRFKLKKGTVPIFSLLAVLLGFLMARVVYCVCCYGYYINEVSQPMMMLHFWDGGYSLFGAGLGVTMAAGITAKLQKDSFGHVMDCVAVFAGVFIILERLGERFTALGLGRTIQTEWLIQMPFFAVLDESDFLVHAVYRYEAVIAGLILVTMLLLAFLGKSKKGKAGDLALVFGGLFGACQVVLESMRNDGHMLWGFVRANQVFSAFLAVAAIIVFTIRAAKLRGVTKRDIVIWVITLGCIVMGILKEFDVDGGENLWLDYGIMAFCMVVLMALTMVSWHRSKKVVPSK